MDTTDYCLSIKVLHCLDAFLLCVRNGRALFSPAISVKTKGPLTKKTFKKKNRKPVKGLLNSNIKARYTRLYTFVYELLEARRKKKYKICSC